MLKSKTCWNRHTDYVIHNNKTVIPFTRKMWLIKNIVSNLISSADFEFSDSRSFTQTDRNISYKNTTIYVNETYQISFREQSLVYMLFTKLFTLLLAYAGCLIKEI